MNQSERNPNDASFRHVHHLFAPPSIFISVQNEALRLGHAEIEVSGLTKRDEIVQGRIRL